MTPQALLLRRRTALCCVAHNMVPQRDKVCLGILGYAAALRLNMKIKEGFAIDDDGLISEKVRNVCFNLFVQGILEATAVNGRQ